MLSLGTETPRALSDWTNTLIVAASTQPFFFGSCRRGQAIFIMPTKNLALFFKYEDEFTSHSHTLSNILAFGGCSALRIPESTGTKK